ncbi:beta galactosidase jelly roll domain-containing protein, partial [candidate division KSB1 bacterium]|nr:beta galactosidase jelly roll domain-containing protein [candidate division KSB1 bacterium]
MLSGKSAFVHHVGLCNRVIRFSILLILFLIQITSCTRGPVPRSLLFDNDWLFIKGTIEGAEKPNYDDSAWRRLDLPHDWSIEDLPILNSPIDSTAVGGVNTGFFVGGTGWYRKHFNIPSAQKGKRLYLQFDGIYMNADVWLNGDHIGNHPYGYTSFYFDITSSILFGRENVLAVEVKNEGKNSRWYSGSGIYRHVWLIQTDPVHIAIWGVAVTTPTISKTGSQVRAMIKIKNQTAATNEITLISTVFDPNGRKK